MCFSQGHSTRHRQATDISCYTAVHDAAYLHNPSITAGASLWGGVYSCLTLTNASLWLGSCFCGRGRPCRLYWGLLHCRLLWKGWLDELLQLHRHHPLGCASFAERSCCCFVGVLRSLLRLLFVSVALGAESVARRVPASRRRHRLATSRRGFPHSGTRKCK